VLAGPWDGSDHLTTNGEVTLYRAEAPPATEPFFVPMTVEDQVNYRGSTEGWPDTTTGNTLNRGVRDYGSNAANWISAPPTPGNVIIGYAAWKSMMFPGGGPGSGDHDDPDQDGFENALEYVLGLPPLTANSTAALLPQFTRQPGAGGTTDYLFTFTRPLTIPGVTCTVQKSSDLITWTNVADVPVSSTATTETRQATVNSATTGRIYLRLNVSIAP
jgi:hypothetical protein